MKKNKMISFVLSAAMAAGIYSAAPAVSAEVDNAIWNYEFEGRDIGGGWSGYYESLVTENPSGGGNHVYQLGANQITKYNDFDGKNVFSFDFEYVEYYNSVSSGAGDCTFSALLYRNGKDYKSADKLSTTNTGALQFNDSTLIQPDTDNKPYYLKGGCYHVEWTVDTENKHQTVTLKGQINGSEQTITVFNGDIAERGGETYSYTSGMQLKGNDKGVYIDNIRAVLYTEQEEPTQPASESPSEQPPTATPAADTNTIWDYAFEGSDIGGNWSGYDESLVTEDLSDESNHVYQLGANQITKYADIKDKHKISFDFEYVNYYNNGAGDCAFYAYLYRNGKDYKSADLLSTTKSGALQFNGENVLQENGTSLYYLKGGRYRVEWTVDVANKRHTVTLTGLINSKPDVTITVFDGVIADKEGVSYEYTSGMQLKGNETGVYIDNIKVTRQGGPLSQFREAPFLKVDNNSMLITGIENGYPASLLEPVYSDGAEYTADIYDIYNRTVTDGGVYDGYRYVVMGNGESYTYVFKTENDIYSNDFNAALSLTDGSGEITSANRGQRDKMFPAADAEYTQTDVKPKDAQGAAVDGWNQSLFQNVVISEDKLALTRESAPYKKDRAIALKTYDYSGTGNIQVIKDFYTADEDYPVQISVSVMPDGYGDVSLGIKTSYYNEPAAANPDATDGSGKNYLATPIAFCADGQLLSFGIPVGRYAPHNWYEVSIVLDKVENKKTAQLYLNGNKLGGEYDWSDIKSTLDNEGFYSLTMRENYKVSDMSVTDVTYFDNLEISKLYSAISKPNGTMFGISSNNTAYTIDFAGGFIYTLQSGASDTLIGALAIPDGADAYVADRNGSMSDEYTNDGIYRLVCAVGEHVESYTVTAPEAEDVKITLKDADGNPSDKLTAGNNTLSVDSAPVGSVFIAAIYNGDGTLDYVRFADTENGTAELSFEANENQTAKAMLWSSVELMQNLAETAEFKF